VTRPTAPRVTPVDFGSLTESQRAVAGIGASNVILTLVRHPDLLKPWLNLAATLLLSTRLSPRARELTILRVALRTTCEYEWANHVLGALAAGATEGEIRALSDPSAAWPDADAALLRAVDDLCDDDCVSETTWAALTATRDEVEIIEILTLIGYYRMNAGLLNSLGVQTEAGRAHLGQVPSVSVAGPRPRPARPSTTESAGGGFPGATQKGVDGTWQITFRHPAGDQELTLGLETRGGALVGSVTNPALGITVPIADGTVEGQRFSAKAPMTMPIEVDIQFDGAVDGNEIAGTVTIRGAGAFPFDGTRAA
jgi:4-carboxymuconolactone decarboxylase